MDSHKRIDSIVINPGLMPIRIAGPMAQFAGRRKPGGDMIGVPCLFVVGPVTTVTIAGRAFINVVLVAGAAVLRRMNSHQGINAVVIKPGLVPA